MKPSPLRASAFLSIVAATAAFATHPGCTSKPGDADAGGPDSGVDASHPRDAGRDTGTPDAPNDVGPSECPPSMGAPAGWLPYQDYGRCCGLHVPSGPEYLPPPVEWEPCSVAVGVTCRQIKITWNATPPSRSGGIAYVDPTGTAYVMGVREVATGRYTYVAEADGKMLSAVLSMDGNKCLATNSWQPLGAGRYLYRIVENLDEGGGGFLGGTVDDIAPTVHRRFTDAVTHAFLVGDPGLLDVTGTLDLLEWPSAKFVKTLASPASDNGLLQNFEFFSGNSLHWSANSTWYGKARLWTEEAGVVDLVDYGPEPPAHSVDDLGTDQIDMAWTEGLGVGDSEALFASAVYMTSPYTTDPKLVVPRRLHSADNYGFGTGPFTVACGKAARSTPWGVIVLRLSDGHAWRLVSQTSKWYWVRPWAMSCTELFVQGGTGDSTLLRVALDSLGDGEPAD